MSLREDLIKQNKLKWLDIGCGNVFEKGFYYLDILNTEKIKSKHRDKYIRLDILKATSKELKKMSQFHLVRMQHVLEHFTFEEGRVVLKNCAKLLEKDGYLLITVPDLKIHAKRYLANNYRAWQGFTWWALRRIPIDAPSSFYFSVFAYSIPNKPPFHDHKWCYDYEGLEYMLRKSRKFYNIRELKKDSRMASYPFTHNRPEEDLCLIAQKK